MDRCARVFRGFWVAQFIPHGLSARLKRTAVLTPRYKCAHKFGHKTRLPRVCVAHFLRFRVCSPRGLRDLRFLGPLCRREHRHSHCAALDRALFSFAITIVCITLHCIPPGCVTTDSLRRPSSPRFSLHFTPAPLLVSRHTLPRTAHSTPPASGSTPAHRHVLRYMLRACCAPSLP